MSARLYCDPAGFLRDVREALPGTELLNSLPFGICAKLAEGHSYSGTPPFLFLSSSDGTVGGAALMTPPHNLVLLHGPGWNERDMEELAGSLAESGAPVPGVLGVARESLAFARAWSDRMLVPARLRMRMGLHALDGPPDTVSVPGALRRVRDDDLQWFLGWHEAFHLDCFGELPPHAGEEAALAIFRSGGVRVWEDGGMPCSMAAVSRSTDVCATVGLVYTPPALRGRGYATGCVAELSRSLLDEGYRWCCLFTDLANPVSNSVYMRIGYRRIEDFAEYRFQGTG